MPLIVPPVPMPATKCVIRPSVCSHSSGPGAQVVRLRVLRVRVLVGLPGPVDLLDQPVRGAVVGVGVVRVDRRRADDDTGPVRLEHVALVLPDLVRADEHAAVALALGHDRQPDTGVAGGGLDDRPAGLQLARRLRGLHHAQGDAVLDAAAGVEVLDLGQHRGREPGGDRPEPHQRGVPDQVGDVLDVAHAAMVAPRQPRADACAPPTGGPPRAAGRDAGSPGNVDDMNSPSPPPQTRLRQAGGVRRGRRAAAARRHRAAGAARPGPAAGARRAARAGQRLPGGAALRRARRAARDAGRRGERVVAAAHASSRSAPAWC